ncbi:MAG: ABC transporter ATP-binding protein/permease, partial [Bdellovibrionaceae bacterium]|nr:ABC transporter ATP-binding protein/permease [Pseudobdellovibrionaceae bacterium]
MDDDTHFRKHLRAERVGLVQSSLLLLLQAIFTAALPLPLMVLIDGFIFSFLGTLQPRPNVAITPLTERLLTEFTSRPTEHLLWWAIGLLGFLLLASAALEWVEQISRTRVSYAVVERLREEMFERLITRRQGYLDRKRKSDLIAHLSTDAGALESLIGSGLGTFARALPTLILMFTLLLWLQPSLAFLVLVTLPLPYYLTLYLARATRIHSARLRSATQNFESEAMRLFAAAPIIKSLTLESFAARVLHSRLEETGQVVLNVRQADGALIAASGGARHALRAVLLVLGGILILRGELSFGALAVFLVAVGPLSRAVASIAQFVSDFGRAESSRDRVEALFAELESQGEVQGPQAWISLPFPDATTLHFENVTFGYQGAPPLLQKFNASFHSGELIALTGPS